VLCTPLNSNIGHTKVRLECAVAWQATGLMALPKHPKMEMRTHLTAATEFAFRCWNASRTFESDVPRHWTSGLLEEMPSRVHPCNPHTAKEMENESSKDAYTTHSVNQEMLRQISWLRCHAS
jgi:hypothetical protein